MSSSIAIARAEEPLPTCTPYLMPFHIDYSGPAPISTYFRVKPAPAPGYLGKAESQALVASETNSTSQDSSESQTSSTSDATLVASSSSATLDSRAEGSSQETLVGDTKQPQTIEPGERFIAAFRGRAVQGLTVNLPEGYTGLVLHGAEEGARKRDGAPARADRAARGEGPRGTRRTRRGSQQEAKVIDADVGAGGAEPEGEDRGEGTRALRPAARFASFVLWNQDIPVDEGRDEYLRALREWTRLAAEVHRAEDI